MVARTYAAPSKREHGHGSVFYPHRSESWRKRTIVWSISITTNLNGEPTHKSGSNAASIRALACSTWIGQRKRGHHLHAHRVTRAFSLWSRPSLSFYADDAFVCDPRTTPIRPSRFNDGLYEAYTTGAAGSVMSSVRGICSRGQLNFALDDPGGTRVKWGAEARP